MAACDRLFLLTAHGPDQDRHERAALDAAVAVGIDHVVKISGSAPSLGPNGPASTAVTHWHSEQRLEASGLRFTFLRPGFLMQGLLDQIAPTVKSVGILVAPMGRAPIAMVDARDVAAAAVATLLDTTHADAAFQLTGPRGVAFPDVAAALGVPYLAVPQRIAARALARRGATAWEVDHAMRMAAYFAAGSDGTTTADVERLTGRPPRAIADFLAEHADAFGGAVGARSPSPLGRLLSLTTKGT
jgi:hypothetical protein